MNKLDVLTTMNQPQLKRWLRSIRRPRLIGPGFFTRLGFRASFVQAQIKRYDKVLCFDACIRHNICGIDELVMIRALADVLGVRSWNDQWHPRDMTTTLQVIENCVNVMEMMPTTQAPAHDITARPHSISKSANRARLARRKRKLRRRALITKEASL